MDFKKFKEKAIDFKNKTISKAAEKIINSGLVVKTKEDLNEIIEKSKNTTFTNEKTLETKEFTKYSIVIFTGKNNKFYEEMLVGIPVLATKAFASNIALKLCDIELSELKKYKIKELPSLVLYKDTKLDKIIVGEENIKTIVKKIDLDIINTIENI